MIQATNLNKQYNGQKALNNLNLTVNSGEIFGLLGQNGAGKTTTIHLFLGLIRPDSGTASIHEVDVVAHPLESKRHLGYLPETVMLYPNLTGLENLDFFSRLAGFRYSKEQLSQYLFRAGLQTQAHHQRMSGYSKGMRQKVGIAIALAKQAKALFLDEPTSGLDPKAANEFSDILKQLSASGTAILMATHDIFRAKEVAHRIGIMKEGNLVSVTDAAAISATELEQLYLQTV